VVTDDVDRVRATAVERLAPMETLPSYARVIELEGLSHAGEVAVIGDEETVAGQVRRYFDAGATEVVVSQTDLGSADERRTWKLLGELRKDVR